MSQAIRKTRLKRLLAQLAPTTVEITDFSKAHQGHLTEQHQETHLHVMIVAKQFEGKTRIERERMIHQCLQDEWQQGLHALTVQALSEKEFKQASASAKS